MPLDTVSWCHSAGLQLPLVPGAGLFSYVDRTRMLGAVAWPPLALLEAASVPSLGRTGHSVVVLPGPLAMVHPPRAPEVVMVPSAPALMVPLLVATTAVCR